MLRIVKQRWYLFDDWFDDLDKEFFGKKNPLYGKHSRNMMKTDVRETEGTYELDVDLPGFKKEDVELTFEQGYLTISAKKNLNKDEKNKEIIHKLEHYGLKMEIEDTQSSSILENMTFVVTGTLPTLSRKEAATLIENNGGKVSGSVSKKTTYLLAGENAGSKLTKAQSLNIPVLTEEMFMEMIRS